METEGESIYTHTKFYGIIHSIVTYIVKKKYANSSITIYSEICRNVTLREPKTYVRVSFCKYQAKWEKSQNMHVKNPQIHSRTLS